MPVGVHVLVELWSHGVSRVYRPSRLFSCVLDEPASVALVCGAVLAPVLVPEIEARVPCLAFFRRRLPYVVVFYRVFVDVSSLVPNKIVQLIFIFARNFFTFQVIHSFVGLCVCKGE